MKGKSELFYYFKIENNDYLLQLKDYSGWC